MSHLIKFRPALALLAGAFMLVAAPSLVAQQASTGYLKAKVNPGRAGVFVDGKYLGPAANYGMTRKYALPAGEHEVTFSDPRYERATTKVTITAGQTATVREALKPLTLIQPPYGRLRVTGGEKFSAVYINEGYMGHQDEFNAFTQGLLLNPGEYHLKIVSPAGATLNDERITIEANRVTHVRVR